MAELVLKDGSKKVFADGISLYDAAKELSNSLAKKVLVAKVNGDNGFAGNHRRRFYR